MYLSDCDGSRRISKYVLELERLLSHGVNQLSTSELLAILLGTGQGAGKL
jgi:DNA repair protein RadC